jgi:glycosyltransferase involved in cell wall biosynthesis
VGEPLRVLVLIDSLTLGGAENLVVAFARLAPLQNMTVSVAAISGTDARTEIEPRLRELGVEASFLSIPRLLSPRALPAVAAAIRASKCDVVHAHLEYAATLAPIAALRTRRPVVSTLHHVPARSDWRTAARERLAVAIAGRAARLIFVSQASMDAFASRYRRNTRTWTVVPNGVDLTAFNPGAAGPLPGLCLPEGAPVVALVAALREGKGHATAIDAWPEVRRHVPGAVLLFVGSGVLQADLEARAARTGVGDAVVFAGLRSDVPALLGRSSLVILPSDLEAFPTVLMEAAAAGRAVVATRVGGTSEIVVDGETGVLVPPGDPEALARAITALLEDHVRREGMGARARHVAEERFDERLWVLRVRRIYEDALANAARGA